MSPRDAVDNLVDAVMAHAKQATEMSSCVCAGQSSHFHYLRFHQFSAAYRLSASPSIRWGWNATIALSRDHVVDVVGLRPHVKVGRITARWIVTVVQHVKSLADWPIGQRVRNSVCADIATAPTANPNDPITMRERAGPFPTLIRTRLVHARPETRCYVVVDRARHVLNSNPIWAYTSSNLSRLGALVSA